MLLHGISTLLLLVLSFKSWAPSTSSGCKIIANFTGPFHLNHKSWLLFQSAFPSAGPQLTPGYVVQLDQDNYPCPLLISQLWQGFYKHLSRSLNSLLVLINVFLLPPCFFFLRYLSISLVCSWYFPKFCFIIKKKFHVRSKVFLQVSLLLLLLVLIQHYISFISGFSSG